MDAIVTAAMDNWAMLNKIISSLTEEQLVEMLENEKQQRKRMMYLERIHQRYTIVRAAREREELLSQFVRKGQNEHTR